MKILRPRSRLKVRSSVFSKIVSEYDQEIPQSQTADNPVLLKCGTKYSSDGTFTELIQIKTKQTLARK